MQKRQSERVYFGMFLTGLFLISILLTSGYSLEPIVNPRILVLSCMAGFILLNSISILFKMKKETKVIIILYLTVLLTILFFAEQNIWEGFFGIEGRRTGLLFYLILVITFLKLTDWSSESYLKKIIKTLILVGVINQAYGFIQFVGLDPITWSSQNRIIGMMGNTNFYSSFVGMSVIATLIYVSEKNSKYRFFAYFSILSGIFIIYLSGSVQGLFVVSGGVITYLTVRSYNKKKTFFSIVAVTLFSSFLVLLDLLQKSPWSPLFYEQSVSARGTFWKTAIEMGNANPIFGLGFNGYRNMYLNYVDRDLLINSRAETVVDSPHNYFLEYYATGGAALLITQALVFIFTVISIISLLRSKDKIKEIHIVSISCWVGFQIQALISPIHVTIQLWGWILGSLIIILNYPRTFEKKNTGSADFRMKTLAIPLTASVFASIIGYLPLQQDHNLRLALQQGGNQAIYEVTQQPLSGISQKIYIANYFIHREEYDFARLVSNDALKLQPQSREILQLMDKIKTLERNQS